MRKFEIKKIQVLSKFTLTAKETQKVKGGNGDGTDAQDNIIIEDIING